jgi:hypothetical protein
MEPETLTQISTVAMAAATIAAAVIAAAYAHFTRQLLRGQVDPKVIVYVKHDCDRRTVLTLNVENIGRDIAYDVTFHASRAIPEHAWGIETASAPQAGTMQNGPFISGIPALGPGGTREVAWGQYGGLTKALDGKPVVLNYEYKTGAGRKLTGRAILEVESYSGTSANETPEAETSKHLGTIAKTLSGVARSLLEIEEAMTGKRAAVLAEIREEMAAREAGAAESADGRTPQ